MFNRFEALMTVLPVFMDMAREKPHPSDPNLTLLDDSLNYDGIANAACQFVVALETQANDVLN